jgi:hypothetical protein
MIIISLLQSTAGHRPLQLLAISLDLSATRIQLLPAILCKSALHMDWECPTLSLRRPGLHSRTLLPQRLSVLRLIWSAHCHFSMPIRCAMSATLVLCRINCFRIRSRRETPSIALFIARWAILNLGTSRAVSVDVSAPYVLLVERTDWSTYSLNTLQMESNQDSW